MVFLCDVKMQLEGYLELLLFVIIMYSSILYSVSLHLIYSTLHDFECYTYSNVSDLSSRKIIVNFL